MFSHQMDSRVKYSHAVIWSAYVQSSRVVISSEIKSGDQGHNFTVVQRENAVIQ